MLGRTNDRPLVYKSHARDAATQLPVFIVDSAALTEDKPLPDPEADLKAYLDVFPESDEFVIVFFASNAPKVPKVGWLHRVHSALPRSLKKRIVRVYVVHANWYTRALNKALIPIVSPKFARKIRFFKTLSELGREVDITAIDINPAVYVEDLGKNGSTVLGALNLPKQCNSIFGTPLPPEMPTPYWRAALQFLSAVNVSDETFMPISRATKEDVELVAVLTHAVRREQRLMLFDYGPFVVLQVLKEYLVSLPVPLIRIDRVPLPLEFSEEYAQELVMGLPDAHMLHLADLLAFLGTVARKHVDTRIVARSMGPCIMGLRTPKKHEYAIAVRALTIMLEFELSLPLPLPQSASKPVHKRPREITPTRTPQPTFEADSISTDEIFTKPRDLPSEISVKSQPRVPNRKAFGKVAEIMRIYDESC